MMVDAAEGIAPTSEIDVTVAPMTIVRERPGITGAGWVSPIRAKADKDYPRIRLLYPNHSDDWGKSHGTGSSVSLDGGKTWTSEPDNTPLPAMIDQWAQQLSDGSVIVLGIRSLPDPKTRTAPHQPPGAGSAWVIGHSSDHGTSWKIADCSIECPAELGVIARPLPPILEDSDKILYMPAYAWSASGHRALLLTSKDRGNHWTVKSTITDTTAVRAAGVAVTTPWLETTIARTNDGGWLAVMRTGSNFRSPLMQVRSVDGVTWRAPTPLLAGSEQKPVAGKLPSLLQLRNGLLVLLTAHSNNHCRVYYSHDGSGRQWSEGYVVTSQTGGNTCMAAVGVDQLVVVTPANGRLYGWPVTLRARSQSPQSTIAAPTNVSVVDGPKVRLAWTAPTAAENVVRYRITPQLMAASNPETEPCRYATIDTDDGATHFDFGRILSIGGRYRFTVAAVDREGRESVAAQCQETTIGVTPAKAN